MKNLAAPLGLLFVGIGLIIFIVNSNQGPATRGPVSGGVEVMPGNAGVDGKTWLVNFDQAKLTSSRLNRPILVDFTGSDWCGWCIRLDEEVFAEREFQAWAEKHVVLLKLDFPNLTQLPKSLAIQNETLRKAYAVQGFPTILFLNKEGEVLAKSGYESGGAQSWIASAENMLGSALNPSPASTPATPSLPEIHNLGETPENGI